MSNTSLTQPTNSHPNTGPAQKPNETGTVSVQAHFRIFDPKTQKTIVEGRA
jgi:hypothetical protein